MATDVSGGHVPAAADLPSSVEADVFVVTSRQGGGGRNGKKKYHLTDDGDTPVCETSERSEVTKWYSKPRGVVERMDRELCRKCRRREL